jgi:hypothetical protein
MTTTEYASIVVAPSLQNVAVLGVIVLDPNRAQRRTASGARRPLAVAPA